MKYRYNDGGQIRALKSGYCATRALCIAAGISWQDAENLLKDFSKKGKKGNAAISSGVYKEDFDAAISTLGYKWQAAPKFQGRKARAADLEGVVIARQAKHFTAVIDGVVNDIWDCSHKMVYGYWKRT